MGKNIKMTKERVQEILLKGYSPNSDISVKEYLEALYMKKRGILKQKQGEEASWSK